MIRYEPIKGFSGYRVGDDGFVWTRRPRNGKGPLLNHWRRVASWSSTDYGHQKVTLWDGHRPRAVNVARVVLTAFDGPCPPGMEACHNDGDASHNALTNLRWDTKASNVRDMAGHGTLLAGEANPMSRLTTAQVRAIRSDRRPQAVVAAEYGVGQATVSKILRRARWRHA